MRGILVGDDRTVERGLRAAARRTGCARTDRLDPGRAAVAGPDGARLNPAVDGTDRRA